MVSTQDVRISKPFLEGWITTPIARSPTMNSVSLHVFKINHTDLLNHYPSLHQLHKINKKSPRMKATYSNLKLMHQRLRN